MSGHCSLCGETGGCNCSVSAVAPNAAAALTTGGGSITIDRITIDRNRDTPTVEQIAACPFCGGEEAYICNPAFSSTYWMRCPNCHIDGPKSGSEAQAIAAWNTRAISPALAEARDALARIVKGSALGKEMFERRVGERKGRLTWYAVNVLQDNLDACEGSAAAALRSITAEQGEMG